MSEIPTSPQMFSNPELGGTSANPEIMAHIGHLVKELAESEGVPYTLGQLLENRDIDVDPAEETELDGVVGRYYEAERLLDTGESLAIIHYNPEGVRWIKQGQEDAPGSIVSEIRYARDFEKAFLNGRIELLDTGEGVVEGECYLPTEYRPTMLTAISRFANKWGVSRIWEAYLNGRHDGTRGAFQVSVTSPMDRAINNVLWRSRHPDLP